MTRTEITIPASTSNLGASFDTCGLALALYLRVAVDEHTTDSKWCLREKARTGCLAMSRT